MALELIHRAASSPSRVAVFPGACNPPTVAHLEIARAALTWADEVIWILPRAFPHKSFEGASLENRVRMLQLTTEREPGFSVALSDGGLYVEIAAEAQETYGPTTEIALLCGRDAAERIATWDYGKPGVFDGMLAKHRLLVAAREGDYVPPPQHRHRIVNLPLIPGTADVSSTEVRRRIREGLPWEHLVAGPAVALVRELYGID